MRLHHLAAVLCLAAACQGPKTEEQKKAVTPTAVTATSQPPTSPAPAPEAEKLLDPVAVVWKAQEVPGLGIQINTIDGVQVLSGSFGGGAQYTRQDMRPITMAIWHNQERTLAEWRKGLGPEVKIVETQRTVCGKPAYSLEVQYPPRRAVNAPPTSMSLGAAEIAGLGAEPSKPSESGDARPRWRETPARTSFGVEFEHQGKRATASFAVETEHLDAWRARIDQFFAGFKCD